MNLAELLLTLLVALLVFGPKKLPLLAHHLGRLMARLHYYQQQWKTFFQQQCDTQQLQDNIKKAEAADRDYQKRL